MLIERIAISGLLSFDAKGVDLPLQYLNVLIGANASGKSNFLTALRLLSDASPIRRDAESWFHYWSKTRERASEFRIATTSPLPDQAGVVTHAMTANAAGEVSHEVASPGHGDKELAWLRQRYQAIRLDHHRDPATYDTADIAALIAALPPPEREMMNEYASKLSNRATGVETPAAGDGLTLALPDWHGGVIPASQISTGQRRFLRLAATLLAPEPAPLILIEEPEAHIHPDMAYVLTNLLIEASERTQLVVTTHSPVVISTLSDHRDSVIACDHFGGRTRMHRVNPDALIPEDRERDLSELWDRGIIDGNHF